MRRHIALALACIAAPAAVVAQPELGRITFPTSGRAEAQPLFLRGVLFLHSFEYDSAARYFREAQRLDPSYAMAYWGEAITYTHPVWYQQDKPAATAVLLRLGPSAAARRALAPTAREKRWLDALEVLYGEGEKTARDTAYAHAMEAFARDFPGDHEVAVFHALALLGLSSTGRDVATYMRSAAIVEAILRENPDHPGALHVAIHAYDDPVHAPLGMRAARVYGQVAPAAAHAQHMTSHIFMSMGLWDDVEQANIAAWNASNRRNGHYTQWLAYAYLQKGRFKDAQRFVLAITKDAAADPTPYKLGYLNTMLAAWVIDSEDWTGPLALFATDSARRVGSPAVFRVEAVQLDFAAAVAALHRRDHTTVTRLRQSIANRTSVSATTFIPGLAAGQVMGELLDAMVLSNRGLQDSAIVVARGAAERESALPFEFGPPEVTKPPYEVLGELLLEAGRAAEARTAFDKALQRAPNRSRSVLGLARAWDKLGKVDVSARHYARFLANCASSDERTNDRDEAERYLARQERR